LNVGDYARVPLLNPDQMVDSWREKLPPLEDAYDRRMISLGRREPGVYLIEAVNGDLRAFGLTIVTDIALVEKTSNDGQMLVYAVERKTGAPREGVNVQVFRGKEDVAQGATDKQGIWRAKIVRKEPPADESEEGEEGADEAAPEEPVNNSYVITATSGENFAINDLDSYYFENGEGEEGGSDITSYVYTDRPVYRPEQKVYFKGILRQLNEQGGYKLLPASTVSVTVEDPSGGRIYEKELKLSSRGTFSGELDLPEESPLGSYNINAQAGESSASGYFEVQEYKKPEYKVRVTTPRASVPVGEKTLFNVSARYFFGAPVTRADVKYYIYRSRHYSWWDEGGEAEADEFGADPSRDEEESGYYGYGDNMVLEGDGKLDAQGNLNIEFTPPPPDAKETWDYEYRLEAQVTDASRRSMDGSTSFIGARSQTLTSAAPERYVYYQGDTAKINVRARDREGRPVRTRVKLVFYERRWEKVVKKTEYGDEYPDYETREKELSSVAVETNELGEAAVDYTVPISGSIQIKTVVDEGGREVVSEAGSIWVTDRAGTFTDVSYTGEEAIKLVPDKKTYKAGETAKVLALLPTDKAHLLVTTELRNVLSVRRIDATGRAIVIDVPIDKSHAPNIFLNVTYVRNSDMYSQDVMLVVPARDKLLNLQIIPNKKEFRPRETASYTMLARNADGTPASGAEVSLGVVDESIYSIAPESVGDIRRAFYDRRYNQVNTTFSVNYYFVGYAGKKVVQLAAKKKSRQFADTKNEGETVNPLIRKVFKDTAFWQPSAVTGPDGKATVQFELPDNLTTWRATARAVTSDTRVGTAITRVVEKKDVIIRMALPRFLTAGDTVTLSGIAHNYLKQEKTTKITIDVQGARLLDPSEKTVGIPSLGEHRVDWRVAAPSTGELKILAKALTDTESDAVELTIPIVPRGLKMTRAESAAFSEDEAEKTFTFNLPANADPNARTFKVEVSPTVAGSLFGALDYLTGYPYGCVEQTMSRFLPTVIVSQTLQSVQSATIRDTNDIGRKVRTGLRRLYNFQHDDGGWGWWKDDQTDAWMTAYVIDGFAQAQRAGYEVDANRLERGRKKLRELVAAGQTEAGAAFNDDTRAYMTYALAESGGADARFVNDLFARRGNLKPYGRAVLALALKEAGDARATAVAADIERTAKASGAEANWETIEATALSVKALARISPKSELLPKAARWLVRARRYGNYWSSTKDTAFAIFGLTDYLKVSQELSPDYAVEVYVNGEQVLAQQMTSAEASAAKVYTFQRKGGEVGGANEVRIVKRGPGVLYLSTTLVHYTNDENTAAQGIPQLKMSREYLRLKVVDKGEGGLGWQVEPLTGEIRSGDIIVSRLKLEGEKNLSYLMIEDPIPAGCEPVEEVSGINLHHTEEGWSDWYSAREFRDQRAVLFLNYFDGSAQFQYAMRVQVPGQFRVAPARVEEMYQPDIRANSASGSLTILDK
jgi:uncharacterized protein YfaS (alpha-2-macroglobulin family)